MVLAVASRARARIAYANMCYYEVCYPDLEETNHTVTERLGWRGLSFNEDSYARTFKCLAVFQAGVVEYVHGQLMSGEILRHKVS